MCQKTWNRLPWLVPPDPAEHNISHVSLSSELLAVKMPQFHRPDPRILRVLRTTDRNLTRCQDNHQRNGGQNCIGPVLAFTHSARRPRPQATTFPIPPPTPSRNCLPICFVHMEMKWQTRMRAEVEQGKSGKNYVDTGKRSQTQTHTYARQRKGSITPTPSQTFTAHNPIFPQLTATA